MRWLLLGSLIINSWFSEAQVNAIAPSGSALIVRRILVTGNKVTQERIILRELSLKPGDSLRRDELSGVLAEQQKRIYNLLLFNRVDVQPLEIETGTIDLLIELHERWYTYPIPIFELSDRNFNEWWENYDRDLSRVNYGLRLYQYNFRGRNETVKLTARTGFSKRFDFYYKIPNLTRNQKHGLVLEYVYNEPSNLAYRTENHILTFLRDNKPLRTGNAFSATYTYRNSFYRTHSLRTGLARINISDTIFSLNPEYLSNGLNNQTFSTLSYRFVAEHRDVIAYPLRGYQVTAGFSAVGISPSEKTRYLNLNGSFAWHREVGNDLYLSLFSSLYINTRGNQPYAMISGIGYDRQYIRGFETYVIEGPVFTLNKVTMKKRIFSGNFVTKGLGFNQFSSLPLAVYLKAFSDFGYVYNYAFYKKANLNNQFSDKPLASAGVGIDFVTYFDSVVRLEYSFTSQSTSGLFLNIRKEF